MKYAIYVSRNGQVIGRFTKKELREQIHCGAVSREDWAWHKELTEWTPVHAVVPVIYVSRDGKVIAEFDDQREILEALRDGKILMHDYFWCEGMAEWQQLSHLNISKAALATDAQKEVLARAGLPFDELTTKAQVSAVLPSARDLPATAKQLALLTYLGQAASENLSKQEAADLIDAALRERERADAFGDWNDDKLLLFPEVFADEITQRKRECLDEYNSLWRKYYARRVSEEQAARIFAYLDGTKPGWTKPRTAMCREHFVPCVEAKIHLKPA